MCHSEKFNKRNTLRYGSCLLRLCLGHFGDVVNHRAVRLVDWSKILNNDVILQRTKWPRLIFGSMEEAHNGDNKEQQQEQEQTLEDNFDWYGLQPIFVEDRLVPFDRDTFDLPVIVITNDTKEVVIVKIEQRLDLRRRGLPLASLHSTEHDSQTGAALWDASIVLSKYMEKQQRTLVRRSKVLELGCGLGLVGMVASLLGASNVLLTDRSELLPLIQSSVERNNHIFAPMAKSGGIGPIWRRRRSIIDKDKDGISSDDHDEGICSVGIDSLLWTNDSSLSFAEAGTFDIVCAADTIYDIDLVEPMLAVAEKMSKQSDFCIMVAFDTSIGRHGAYQKFRTIATDRFCVQTISSKDRNLNDKQFEKDSVELYVLTKKQ